ncbi:MAG: DNA polymerase III subunit alpha, partial [Bacteroidales bacterium]|nr:DNA polymerase III subunit alpha [Bacteroidales bacterium]
LYRPGPMDNIPSFIRRKQGEEEIKYDIPVMERYLKDTYGITVYQEQVMLLSRLLANFTRGQSDTLRKAMGKKQIAKMMELKEKFLDGGMKNGHDKEILEKIWSEWEKFASYAFNKSHATCYSWVAYQTAYLKAHYPSQYMAAVLSRNVSNIKEITKSMGECKSMGIQVLGPDVNESHIKFGVNAKGDIRFGLAAIKGVGEGAAENITIEREKNGPYKDIFDFVERISLSTCNKKVLESLAIAGGFDSFGIPRETYVTPNPKNETFIEILSRYGDTYQRDKIMNSNSLFGEDMSMHISKPPIPKCELWNDLERLSKEKDLIGIFLSAHPLDRFHMEIESFTTNTLNDLQDLSALENKDVTVAGMVIETTKGQTKTGKDWGSLTLQDYTDKYRFSLFGNNFVEFGKYINDNSFLLVSGKVQEKPFWPKKDEKETDPKQKKELEFKIKKIYLLSEVKDDLIKEFTIITDLNTLDKDFLKEIITNVKHNKGKTSLGFNIVDPKNKISVKMFSRTHRFKVNDDILNLLSERQLKYKVN